jgi:hypothetical protein
MDATEAGHSAAEAGGGARSARARRAAAKMESAGVRGGIAESDLAGVPHVGKGDSVLWPPLLHVEYFYKNHYL